jgi:imidazolonepropionase-like amidohydrolase
MDEATARLMAEKGIWLSTQPFTEDLAIGFPPGSEERNKAQQLYAATDKVYNFAKKYKLKTAFGTDIVFSQKMAQRQGAMLASLVRWYTPAEALKMATGDNAQLLALSGLRSPYAGKLGVVEEGALADLVLVDGDPIANLKLIEDPAKNFVVIMKDGTIYKDTLSQGAPLQPTGRTDDERK